jgi:hypothetical protein
MPVPDAGLRAGGHVAPHRPSLTAPPSPLLIGVDFTSRPTPRKPIVAAAGELDRGRLRLGALHRFVSDDDFAAWLESGPAWIGGFDLPFGLPRELVEQLGWPTDWAGCMSHYAALDRPTIRATFAAFCAARPAGSKFAHRACDRPAGSSPAMKWVNPPVAYMLHAGVPILRQIGAWFPAHQPPPAGPQRRVALEAYPGLLARAVVGRRSYKSDDRARRTPEKQSARAQIVDALVQGRTPLGIALRADPAQRAAIAGDPSGDALDAVLCLMQAAWAAERPGFGLPRGVDPLEGWIVSA